MEEKQIISKKYPKVYLWIIFISGLFVGLTLILGGVQLGWVPLSTDYIRNLRSGEVTKPTDSLETLTDEVIEEWKTYRDQEYGISFDYPAEWEIMEKNDISDPMPLYSKYIYFIKKGAGGQTYVPSLFSIRLFLNKGEEDDRYGNFKNFYERTNENILQKIDAASTNSYATLKKINLGGRGAVELEDPNGMMYGSTYITWFSDKKAVVMGSIGFQNWPLNQFEELGLPPYGDNEVIGRIISSFQIQDTP